MYSDDKFWNMGTVAAVVIVLLVIGVPVLYKYCGSEFVNADSEIYQQSLSYKRGTIENLQRLKLSYETADNDNHRASIRQMALTTVSSFDETLLPPHLQKWVSELRSQK